MPYRTEHLLSEDVRDKVYPGAVWGVDDSGGVRATVTTGVLAPYEPDVKMRLDTVFDAASLTKILAVWASIGALWEDSVLDLDAPLGSFWGEAADHPLGSVTTRQLLTHTADLPLRAQLKNLYGTDPADISRRALHEALNQPPGEAVEYTDRATLNLGHLAEHLSSQTLAQPSETRTWRSLGMEATRFSPLPADIASRCAPTELDQDTGTHLKGAAYDFSARLLGGVCGIASAFTVLDNLAVFLRYMLDHSTAPPKPASAPSGAPTPSPRRPVVSSRNLACSGTQPPTSPTNRTSGPTTASRTPAYGSPGPLGGPADQQALLHPRPPAADRRPQRLPPGGIRLPSPRGPEQNADVIDSRRLQE